MLCTHIPLEETTENDKISGTTPYCSCWVTVSPTDPCVPTTGYPLLLSSTPFQTLNFKFYPNLNFFPDRLAAPFSRQTRDYVHVILVREATVFFRPCERMLERMPLEECLDCLEECLDFILPCQNSIRIPYHLVACNPRVRESERNLHTPQMFEALCPIPRDMTTLK